MPKFFTWAKDGGPTSTVDAFFIVEIKSFFSLAILKFNNGGRENFHSHAFDAFTWFLSGDLLEEDVNGTFYKYKKRLIPKLTKKEKVHRVYANKDSYCLTIRGPWDKTWFEVTSDKKKKILLTNQRKVLEETNYEQY